jgi:hypothetical protein
VSITLHPISEAKSHIVSFLRLRQMLICHKARRYNHDANVKYAVGVTTLLRWYKASGLYHVSGGLWPLMHANYSVCAFGKFNLSTKARRYNHDANVKIAVGVTTLLRWYKASGLHHVSGGLWPLMHTNYSVCAFGKFNLSHKARRYNHDANVKFAVGVTMPAPFTGRVAGLCL